MIVNVKPARRGCVVACSDGNWAWQSSFMLMRSMAFDTEKLLDHHLYLAGDVDQRILDVLPPEITLHRIEELPETFSAAERGHIPAASLLRLIALEELGRSYQRVIYLDGDVFQRWGTLADLVAVDLEGKPVAAVRDRLQWPSHMQMQQYINQLARRSGADRLHYFNSGVLLIDGPAYIGADVSARTFAFINDNLEHLRYVDQCALNAVLAGQWCELSPGWNWQMSPHVFGLTAGRCPRLIHFVGPMKPWRDPLRLLPPEAFDAMFRFLKSHGLTDLLSDRAPCHFDYRTQERARARKLEEWGGGTFAKREAVKGYLDRTDFADLAAGLRSFG